MQKRNQPNLRGCFVKEIPEVLLLFYERRYYLYDVINRIRQVPDVMRWSADVLNVRPDRACHSLEMTLAGFL